MKENYNKSIFHAENLICNKPQIHIGNLIVELRLKSTKQAKLWPREHNIVVKASIPSIKVRKFKSTVSTTYVVLEF